MSPATWLAPILAAAACSFVGAGLVGLGASQAGEVAPEGEIGTRARPAGLRAARRRALRADGQVPQLLDLLAAGSSAGLSAELALRRAAAAVGEPLGGDLGRCFERVDLGGRWREEIESYALSSGSADLRRTVAILRRTESLGSSLVDATGDLASAVRRSRRAKTMERARTAPVKMLFPLVFLILPAFLLLTVVPVLLTTVRSIS